MMKEQSPSTPKSEGSTSKMKAKMFELSEEPKLNDKEDGEKNNGRNKFKKVEMSVFNGEDPNSWLFHADRYFHIHKPNSWTDVELV